MTETLRQRIARHEGCRLSPYRDSLGFPTQGYGHLLTHDKLASLDQFPRITQVQADEWLDQDIAKGRGTINLNEPWVTEMDSPRQDVLVEMVFQLGLAGFQKFKGVIDACKCHDFNTAADEMLDSQWHKQTPKRCEELAELMREGGDHDGAIA